MEEFLKLAGEIVSNWEKAILADRNVFSFNEKQCTRLWRNVRAVYKVFAPSCAYCSSAQQRCFPLYKDFYRIVVRADAIVKACSCEESWLQAAVLYGDNRPAFQQLTHQLKSCVESFQEVTQSLFRSSEIDKPSNVVAVAIHDDEADEDFRADVENLMERLEELVKQACIVDKEKLDLSSYLIEREKNRSRKIHLDPNGPADGLSDVPKFYEVDTKDIFHVDHIGRGAFGVVSKVRWLGLMCAQKLLELPKEAVLKEVCALVALNHPYIVQLLCCKLGCSSDKPMASLVMELMPMNLHDYILQQQKNPLSAQERLPAAIDVMLQIAVGVEYLHGQAVVHRDLKSMNILVAPSTHEGLQREGYADIKLTDFGLAKMKVHEKFAFPTVGGSSKCANLGTPNWMAPEAMDIPESQRIDWRKADTYSFGITCSEILLGNVPYCEVEGRVRQKVKEGLRPVLPESCPLYLSDLLQRCWAKNPEERPSFEEIVHNLTQFKTRLLMGLEPYKSKPCTSKSVQILEKLRSISLFSKNMLNAKFDRRSLLCPDESEKGPFESAVEKFIHRKLDMVEVLCSQMKEHLTKIQVCYIQCNYLVEKYLEGAQIVKSTYNQVFLGLTLWNLYRSKTLEQCSRGLDALICSMMAVEDLLRRCGGSEWTRTALAISAPPPEPTTLSVFGIYLRELCWHIFVIRCITLGTKTSRFNDWWIQWSTERRSLVLRRIINNEDADDEFLKADADRQVKDRNKLRTWLRDTSSLCCAADNVFSRFCPSEVPIDDRLAARLEKSLKSPYPTINWDSHQDCYWIAEHPEFKVVKQLGDWDTLVCVKSTWLGEVVAGCIMKDNELICLRGIVAILARVQHPNVVHFIGYGSSGLHLGEEWNEYYIMENMQEDLGNLIERNKRLYNGAPFPLPVTIDILLQIVEAMLHVHKCGVIHRDLHPFNILVTPKYALDSKDPKTSDINVYYTVKLTDFAIAQTIPNKPGSSDVFFETSFKVGDVPYMDLEVWDEVPRERRPIWSIDVWMFGMTAYHIVSGSTPARRIDRGYFREIIEEKYPAIPHGCPEGLKQLIVSCWAFNSQLYLTGTVDPFELIQKELWALKYNEEVHS